MTYGFLQLILNSWDFSLVLYLCYIIKSPMPKSSKTNLFICCYKYDGVARVYLLYHSNVQVIAGLITGVTLGIIYFIITSVARDVGLVEWILKLANN